MTPLAVGRAKCAIQYIANLCLKINLKLGGHNVHPSPQGCALVQDAPTMVIGADVYHAPPGTKRPSFAAVVSSMDRQLATYVTSVSAQLSHMEVIERMEEMISHHLRRFYELNRGVSPKRLIFYRDGVGVAHFPMLRKREIAAIRRACHQVGGVGYKPALTFIVVQKRNHCRMFVPRGNSVENATPGTVIDKEITSNSSFDFYLCSHHGLKGTSCPTHYHVLHDDLCLTADELQRFSFDLCHLYARCTKIVSNPAPCYYAHLAATQAHFYMSDFCEDGVEPFHDPQSQEQSLATAKFHPLVPRMQDRLYYA